MTRTSQLSVELERAALRAVRRSYDDINGTHFRWALRAPSFELVDSRSRLGRWVGDLRLIELSRPLLLEHGWGVLVEVLKHEMVHQYVEEVLGVVDESSHGPVFRKVCTDHGFDFRAAGVPVAKNGDESTEGRILDRIAKLLALAESPNEHEAQAAMNAAQRLMLRYNIDELASGRAHAYTFRHIGEPTGRVSESERLLAAILQEYFFVAVIRVHVWRPLEGKRGTVLEVCGTPANVELAAYVHSFLTHTAERLFREHKRKNRLRGNGTRRSFVAGVMGGFREKLAEERKKSQSEGLVWVGDPGLGDYFKMRHPRIRWTRYRSQQGTQAYQEGKRAGRTIVLHRGVGKGPGASVRLLGAASSSRADA